MPQQNWREAYFDKFVIRLPNGELDFGNKATLGHIHPNDVLAFIETLLARVGQKIPDIWQDSNGNSVDLTALKTQLRSEFGIKEGRDD